MPRTPRSPGRPCRGPPVSSGPSDTSGSGPPLPSHSNVPEHEDSRLHPVNFPCPCRDLPVGRCRDRVGRRLFGTYPNCKSGKPLALYPRANARSGSRPFSSPRRRRTTRSSSPRRSSTNFCRREGAGDRAAPQGERRTPSTSPVHENPNVPPSVRNHAPGYVRDRPLVPPDRRKKPGPKPEPRGSHSRAVGPRPADRSSRPTPVEVPRPPTQAPGDGDGAGDRGRAPSEGSPSTAWRSPIASTAARRCGPDSRTGERPRAMVLSSRARSCWGRSRSGCPIASSRSVSPGTGSRVAPPRSRRSCGTPPRSCGPRRRRSSARLRASPWVHADESSYRIDGRKVWIWTFGTDRDLLLVIRPSRGREVVEEVLGKDYRRPDRL